MTKDEIIRMAREAKCTHVDLAGDRSCATDRLERFANLVALHEREACAFIAEQGFKYANDGYEIADKIRSQS